MKKNILLSIFYIVSKAFGWCLISFITIWALLVEFTVDLISYAILGLILISIGEFILIKLLGENNK